MKTLGVLLLFVVCVASGTWVKNKDPTIKGVWLSEDKKASYLYLSDETWVEYLTTDKEGCKRYKTVAESENGYKIIKSLDSHDNFYLAIGDSKVLYREKTYEYIESKGHLESKGSWLTLQSGCIMNKMMCPAIDVCAHKTCPKFKHAKCVPDRCKGCNGIKWINKEIVVKCTGDHSESDSHSNESDKCEHCHEDPCHKKNKCHAYPHAKCVRDCKKCRAKWYFKKEKVSCNKESNSHSNSHSNESDKCEHCHEDPCHKKNKCHAYPHAKCKRDCKKCKAKWYFNKEEVSCSKGCENPVHCLINPCKVQTKCNGYPHAKCTADYCKGCHARWMLNGKEVHCIPDAHFYDEEKQNKCGMTMKCKDMCEHKTCNKNHKAKCKLDYCNGCTPVWVVNHKIVHC